MRAPLMNILRRSLIGLMILVMAAVLFNYLHFWRGRSRSKVNPPPILSSEMMRSLEGVEYTDNQNGRARFKIRARRLLETKLGKSLLQGIEAYDFNPDGSVHNQIRSDKAEYDRERKIADFSGDVRLFLGRGIELRTDSLHYDMNSSIGTTPDMLRLLSREASGTARGARFDQKEESLQLQNEVVMSLDRKKTNPEGRFEIEQVKVQSDTALFSQKSNRVVFQGRVHIQSGSDSLSGDLVEISLTPDQRHVTSLASTGNAGYRSGDSAESRTLSGDRIVFNISPSGKTVDTITMTGNASFSSLAPSSREILRGAEISMELDPVHELPRRVQSQKGFELEMTQGAERTFLCGDQLNAQFIPATKNLREIHVTKQARMMTGGPPATNELRADEMRISFREFRGSSSVEKLRADGSAQWMMRDPARTVSADSIEMIAYAKGTGMESSTATGKVSIVESGRDKTVRRMLSDSARFHFFPGDTQIKQLDSEGHVQVRYENMADPSGNSTATSDHLKADFDRINGKSALSGMSQWGNFSYKDNSKSATAGRCDYDSDRTLLVLRESPRIVSDDMGNTTGELVQYDQKQKILTVRNRVKSILISKKGEGAFFGSSGSNGPVLVTADELQYYSTERGRARYSGSVQLLSENGQLRGRSLEIINRGERVDAEGDVRHMVPLNQKSPRGAAAKAAPEKKPSSEISGDPPMRIESSALHYVRETNLIVYSGNVVLHSRDINLTSDSLEGVLDKTGNKIDHAIARGKVLLHQGARQAKGEEAEYHPDSGKSVIIGSPAEVYDPGKGRSSARRLTWSRADDSILLENH